MTPRDYQDDAAMAFIDYLEGGGTGNPLVAAPTGVGKSIVIAHFLKLAFTRWSPSPLKILVITDSKVLIRQNYEKLLQLWPTAPAGICSDGLDRKDTRQPIIFGGIGTVANIPLYFGHVDLVMVDECHMISLKESSMYQRFFADLRTVNPDLKVLGLTATKFRMGQGLLTEGDGALFTDIVVDMTTMEGFNWFLDEGYLARLRPVITENEYDWTGVRTTAGEYNQADLADAVGKKGLTQKVCAEALRIAQQTERHTWLVFASGVKHTVEMTEELVRLGLRATCIHSNTKEFKMSDAEADERLEAFLNGEYDVMVNNGKLTKGFDCTRIDYIVMTRRTKSVPLWIQMLGRGTRPHYASGFDLTTAEGRLNAIAASIKPYCLVADFAGNCRELGPINDPQIPKPKGKKEPGDAPIRICDKCGTYNHASATVCDFCGAEFPRVLQLEVKAAKEELIATPKEVEPPKVEIFEVKRVEYTTHLKAGKPPSIRVTYYTGKTRRDMEWVCLEHEGGVLTRAKNWWRQRCDIPPPDTTIEALQLVEHLREPKRIHVRIDNGNRNIINYDF